MYRVIQLSGQIYALEISSVIGDLDNINQFVEEGEVVMLCDELDSLEKYGINTDEIETVEND